MNEYLTYLKKFYIAILIFVFAIIIAVFLVKQTIPEFGKIKNAQNDYKAKAEELVSTEQRLSELSSNLEKEKAEDEKIIKAFFTPENADIDSEAAISEEFNEILQILRENKIKTMKLNFQPNPSDDSFVIHASDKYYVSKMTAEMIASYTNFENFLRDLYKHEHFLDISRIEIKPYNKNKRILIIDIQIKFYAQKVGGIEQKPVTPAAQSDSAPTQDNNTITPVLPKQPQPTSDNADK